MKLRQCPECPALYTPNNSDQVCCSIKCSRIYLARNGIPSFEDKKALIMSLVGQKIDELFREDKQHD